MEKYHQSDLNSFINKGFPNDIIMIIAFFQPKQFILRDFFDTIDL